MRRLINSVCLAIPQDRVYRCPQQIKITAIICRQRLSAQTGR
jgi:hypothetical protein